MGFFNDSTQSTRHVSICLTKLNDLMDSFNLVQDSIMELDQGHDKDDNRLLFEEKSTQDVHGRDHRDYHSRPLLILLIYHI